MLPTAALKKIYFIGKFARLIISFMTRSVLSVLPSFTIIHSMSLYVCLCRELYTLSSTPPPDYKQGKYRKTILTHILFLLFLAPLSISTQAFSCACFHSMNLHFQLTNTFCLTSMTSLKNRNSYHPIQNRKNPAIKTKDLLSLL